MPIEQLLAQYGYVMDGGADAPDADDAPGPSRRQTKQREAPEHDPKSTQRPAKRRRTSEGIALSSQDSENQLHSAAQASSAHPSPAQHPSESDSESEDGSADLRDLLEDADVDKAAAAATAGKGRASASSPKPEPPDLLRPVEDMDELDSGHSESEDFDSAAGSAGDDDEQTLEEEERMARTEGAPQPVGFHASHYILV